MRNVLKRPDKYKKFMYSNGQSKMQVHMMTMALSQRSDLNPSIGSTEVRDSSRHFVDQKEKVDLGPTPSPAPLLR